LVEEIEDLIDDVTRGDPEPPLRWTCQSVKKVEKSLKKTGYAISDRTVARILHEQEYSLQANRKTSEGKKDHSGRDQQFRYINERAKEFLRAGDPVISVDTKKKELVGNYKNSGHEWKQKGRVVEAMAIVHTSGKWSYRSWPIKTS
jgi:hypothetical protein